MNTERIDQFIEFRGVRRTLTDDDWRELIRIVCDQSGGEICYRFCLFPQQAVPQKEVFSGFPGRVLEHLDYLNIVELFLFEATDRELVISFLQSLDCPWELISQFDPDIGSDEPIGMRIRGFTAAVDDSQRAQQDA